MSDQKTIKEKYRLREHVEGGWFAEVYTSPADKDGRPLMGSIYFLLDAGQISHFHEIDCDEIWYYHEGCGMKITMLSERGIEERLLGPDTDNGQSVMVVIPEGVIFAAQNLESEGYTFVSCVTTPQFEYSGFRLVNKKEIRNRFPDIAEDIEYLAY